MTRHALRSLVALLAILVAGFPEGVVTAQVTRNSGFPASKDPSYEAMVNKIGAKPEAESQIPLNAKFVDHTGETVTLSKYIDGSRPVIVNLLFFSCSTACNDVSKKVLETVRAMDWTLGDEFDVLTISFDPSDGPAEAELLREDALERYGRNVGDQAWPHLTGEEDSIRRVAESLAFHYQWNEEVGQFAHPSVIYLVTPQGKLSRYYEGTLYGPTDIKYSLVDASQGKVGSIWDHLSLFCLSWDPQTGQWVTSARRVMSAGAALTLLLLGTTIYWAARSRKRSPQPSTADGEENVSLGTQP